MIIKGFGTGASLRSRFGPKSAPPGLTVRANFPQYRDRRAPRCWSRICDGKIPYSWCDGTHHSTAL